MTSVSESETGNRGAGNKRGEADPRPSVPALIRSQESRGILGRADRFDVDLAARFSLLNREKKIMLTFAPKAGCSMLKNCFVFNAPFYAEFKRSGLTVHDFCHVVSRRQEAALRKAFDAPDIFRYAVVRDPLSRIVSAYIQKLIVGPARGRSPGALATFLNIAIKRGQELAGVAHDPDRSISFAEFVGYLAQAPNHELDVHFLPQSVIFGRDPAHYSAMVVLERVDELLEMLNSRFGVVPVTGDQVILNQEKGNNLPYNRDYSGPPVAGMLPADLFALKGKLGFPVSKFFLTPEVVALLQERYADDVELHAKLKTA